MPTINRCWFAARIVGGRYRYRLTVDRLETDALERVFLGCDSTEMIFQAGAVPAIIALAVLQDLGPMASRASGMMTATVGLHAVKRGTMALHLCRATTRPRYPSLDLIFKQRFRPNTRATPPESIKRNPASLSYSCSHVS